MDSYQTTAKVEPQGELHLAGVPFAPGTDVAVTIKPAQADAVTPALNDRAGRLFAALDAARNTASVGPLRREELYDRKVLR